MSNKFNSIWEVPTGAKYKVIGQKEVKSIHIYQRDQKGMVMGASFDKDGNALPYGTVVHFSKLRK